MRCDICNQDTSINWGNAYTILCETHSTSLEGQELLKNNYGKPEKLIGNRLNNISAISNSHDNSTNQSSKIDSFYKTILKTEGSVTNIYKEREKAINYKKNEESNSSSRATVSENNTPSNVKARKTDDTEANPRVRSKPAASVEKHNVVNKDPQEKIEKKEACRVFLCHSSGDKEQVRNLYHILKSDGFNPWFDEEDLLPGVEWEPEITKAVHSSNVVLVCLSESSVTKAGFVQKEIKFALDKADEMPEGKIYLIPAKLEECSVPNRLSKWQWVNLFDKNGYKKLTQSLNKAGDNC